MIKIKAPLFLRRFTSVFMEGGYDAMSFFIFLIYKSDDVLTKELENHERIHLHQQWEMLFVGQWICYLLNLIINLIRYKGDAEKSYREVVFEREAYTHENDLEYLTNRRVWAWTKYIFVAPDQVNK